MRSAITGLMLAASLGACGEDEARSPAASITPEATAGAPMTATPTVAAATPKTRADGRPWGPVPETLSEAVSGDVLVAEPVGEREQAGLGCEPAAGDAEPRGGAIDEYALVTTWRATGTGGEVDGEAIVERCTMRWTGRWEQVPGCSHYAPAQVAGAVATAGGGLIYCEDVADHWLAMAWVEPPADTRWVVVHRDAGYAIAYQTAGAEPVHVTIPMRGRPDAGEPLAFSYDSVTADGRVESVAVRTAVAG